VSEVLAIFAKAPEAGRVKTRLVPPLTAEAAATIYEASLLDVVAAARGAGPVLRLFFDDQPGAANYFRAAFPDIERRPQGDGDLGDRLRDAFGQLFTDGADRAAIIGTDSPTLPRHLLDAGFAAIREPDADVALGPTHDGGYYLVAVRRSAWPAAATLFEAISWSTESVLDETLARAKAIGLDTRLLDRWYDIDRPEDLIAARRDAPVGSHLGRLLEGR
jgi:rSAM/selenodomain-associated transferase 1